MTHKLSVSAALSKIKTLTARIERVHTQIKENPLYLSLPDSSTTPPGYRSKEEFYTKSDSLLQQYKDLVLYRRILKAVVNRSNVVTEVEWNGETYTISELIQLKADIELERQLYNTLNLQHRKSARELETYQTRADLDFSELIKGRSSEEAESLKTLKKNPYTLVSNNVDNTKEALIKYIEKVTSEVDVLLSEKNATTIVEIPYPEVI